MMRIIFVADVHHSFSQIDRLLRETESDLYLITGDLVSRAFYRYGTTWRFMELQQALAGVRTRENIDETLNSVAETIIKSGESHPYFLQAKEYALLAAKAEKYLKKSYQRLESIFKSYPGKNIYVLPGNYDVKLETTELRNRDLHMKFIESGGLRIAGIGGAGISTPGIPDHLQEPHEKEVRNSSLMEFLKESNPHILVLHQPPYGYFDRIPEYGHTGNHTLRDFIDEADVNMVFSGHHHDQWGGMLSNGTYFFNPSNFGRTTEISGVRQGGFFFDIALKEKNLKAATLRRIEKSGIYDIIDFQPEKEQLETIVLDEPRYKLLGGKLSKKQHIEPIRQFQRIRTFFLNYETPESNSLLKEMREIYREIQTQGIEVAFDLLGSISFGIAQRSSDMDVVVYMRSRDCVLDDEDTCGVPRPLAAVFDQLKKRHLEVEVCDSLDLDRILLAIENEDSEDGQLQRFVFYRLVCRPVNLRVIKRVENRLFEKEHFRKKVEEGLKEYIKVLVSSMRHVKSFEKYKTRLKEQNIEIPPDIEEAIRNYLRG
ncbi:metallophosphoesterase [Thermodesulfobacteriota bacterium]